MEDKRSNSNHKLLKRLKRRKVGVAFLVVQAIVTIVLTVLLIKLQFLKPIYISGIFAVLLLFFILMFFGQGSKGRVHIPLKIVIVILCVIMGYGCYYVYKGMDTVSTVTDSKVKDEFQIVVLKDSPAEDLDDVANEEFGIDVRQKNDAYNSILEKINSQLESTITTKEYVDSLSLVDALYNKECNVILLNTAVISDIKDEHEAFESETRILDTYSHVTEQENNTKVSSITEEPFSVFISGIDTYGDISTKSRSDVNMIATVNPKTKEILLTSTPRDYFVQTTVSGGEYDKLTHAGLYGIECSVGTLENLYGVDINYYAKVNFTGFKNVIDALGSVTVHSDYTFTAQHGETFREGDNQVDGDKALAFVRERHAFGSGDLQRNKNQQALVKAVIEKVASPAIIGGFTGIMDAVKDSVLTNMSYEEISAFVKMQLDDGSSWHISMFGVSGEGGKSTTYSNQSKAGYVMYIDEEKVSEASGYIQQVINGQIPSITTD